MDVRGLHDTEMRLAGGGEHRIGVHDRQRTEGSGAEQEPAAVDRYRH